MTDLTKIVVGDRIRISVELLRQLYDMPDHSSELVEVYQIREGQNEGEKTIVLSRIVGELRMDQ